MHPYSFFADVQAVTERRDFLVPAFCCSAMISVRLSSPVERDCRSLLDIDRRADMIRVCAASGAFRTRALPAGVSEIETLRASLRAALLVTRRFSTNRATTMDTELW